MLDALWLKCQAATIASVGGLQRLTKERAFLYELVASGLILGYFYSINATWQQMLLFMGLALGVFAVEALNTAIEVIVDHVSPEWSEMAKHAKDLGSFAVSCMLLMTVLYILWVCWG